MTSAANTNGAINRITKEIAHIEKGTDVSLAVACRDDDVRALRALIIGPPDTPYEFGFFEFQVKFPKDYPIKSPSVTCITTNNGRTRFNPNIYAGGKVCLSILGTWQGEKGEEWSSAQGLESVLLSIQSLMSPNPWENEPGEENGKITDPKPAAYAAKVQHESLRITVIDRIEKILKIKSEKASGPAATLTPGHAPVHAPTDATNEAVHKEANPSSIKFLKDELKLWKGAGKYDSDLDDDDVDTPGTESSVYEYDAEATYNSLNPTQWDPFKDLLKRRFLWYYDSYVSSIQEASSKQRDGSQFEKTRFEGGGNSMSGTYCYTQLLTRLHRIREVLSDERKIWTQQGVKQVADNTGLATQLAFQFNQLEHKYNKTTYNGSRLELSLPDKKNPFAWHLILDRLPRRRQRALRHIHGHSPRHRHRRLRHGQLDSRRQPRAHEGMDPHASPTSWRRNRARQQRRLVHRRHRNKGHRIPQRHPSRCQVQALPRHHPHLHQSSRLRQ